MAAMNDFFVFFSLNNSFSNYFTILSMFKYSRRGILSRVRNFSSDNSSSGDYYETLGIKRSASQAEVKTAYFELSKKYHPDTAKESPENLQKFREVTDAYEVLGKQL